MSSFTTSPAPEPVNGSVPDPHHPVPDPHHPVPEPVEGPRRAFSAAQVVAALPGAAKKLNPAAQWRNPVMFLVWIGAALTTLIAVAEPFLGGRDDSLPFGFNTKVLRGSSLSCRTRRSGKAPSRGVSILGNIPKDVRTRDTLGNCSSWLTRVRLAYPAVLFPPHEEFISPKWQIISSEHSLFP